MKIVDIPFDPQELTVDLDLFRKAAPLARPAAPEEDVPHGDHDHDGDRQNEAEDRSGEEAGCEGDG